MGVLMPTPGLREIDGVPEHVLDVLGHCIEIAFG